MELLDRVRATIRRHDLIRPGMRVVAALSGGPDSVALTYLLRALEREGDLTLAGLAHLNHRLREEAAAEASFCADLARSLGLPIDLGEADVRAIAARDGVSIEAAAHSARYAFLADAATRLRSDRVALGHSLDDQAETVLLRLVRGAGVKGLSGMHPRNGLFIRPLLEVRRNALRAYLESGGHPFLTDASNLDRRIPRNRVRAELLPWLEREFNPRIADVLAGEADLAREEWQWLRSSAEDLLRSAGRLEGSVWSLDADAIRRAPLAVARTALRSVMEQLSGGRPIALRHVATALEICGFEGRVADFPGHRMKRVGSRVVLTSSQGNREATEVGGPANFFAHPLSIPGEALISEAECTVSAEVAPSSDGFEAARSGRGDSALVPLDLCGGSLMVRNRRPGDRFRLPGLDGRTKIQDLFVDRKVPRHLRDRVPLVVDDCDRIVWVAGHSIASEFLVTDPAQAVIILRLKLWGGSA